MMGAAHSKAFLCWFKGGIYVLDSVSVPKLPFWLPGLSPTIDSGSGIFRIEHHKVCGVPFFLHLLPRRAIQDHGDDGVIRIQQGAITLTSAYQPVGVWYGGGAPKGVYRGPELSQRGIAYASLQGTCLR